MTRFAIMQVPLKRIHGVQSNPDSAGGFREPCSARGLRLDWTGMVRMVLFDIDGTLIRTGGAGMRAFAKVFATEFNAVDGFERLKFAGRTDLSLVREFFGFHGIRPTEQHFQRFFDRYAFWLERYLAEGRTEVCAGVWELIRGLQGLARPPLLGLLTGNIRVGAELKLRQVRLWEVFATGAFGDDHEERSQIAALAWKRGCEVMKEEVRPEEVLVIGDTAHDIGCARAIGARVLAVATGGATVTDLEPHQADWTVSDLTAISAESVTNAGGWPLPKTPPPSKIQPVNPTPFGATHPKPML
jgi:phosphoglycolate phosphatase-like HAD superfamily hydrolase